MAAPTYPDAEALDAANADTPATTADVVTAARTMIRCAHAGSNRLADSLARHQSPEHTAPQVDAAIGGPGAMAAPDSEGRASHRRDG